MDILPLDIQCDILKRATLLYLNERVTSFKPKYMIGFTFGINALITLEWEKDLVESEPWEFLDMIRHYYDKSIGLRRPHLQNGLRGEKEP